MEWGNKNEVYGFIIKTAKYCCATVDCGDLIIAYEDRRGRKFKTVIPLFGWVVRDDKTLLFYRDPSFKRTFEEVQEDSNKGIDWEGMDKTIKEVFDCFDNVFEDFKDVFGSKLSEETLDEIKMSAHINPNNPLAKMVDNIYSEDGKIREQAKKMLSKDTNKATFESVLDEMKELHAKKDKDYGSAFHKSFEEFGVTAGVVRLNDKMERAKSLVKNGKAEVKDESLLDTLKDMASYAVMLYVELKNKDNG